MENGAKSRVITLQAGETVTLTAKNGNTISEVKKPKRNAKKEREWEKEKYHRFTFLVDKQLGQQFIDALGDIRPLDWFKEQLKAIVKVDETTLKVDETTLKVDALVKCARCGTLSDGYENGYFQCAKCEFGNYEPVEEDCEAESEEAESPKPKPKKRKASKASSPTTEIVNEWMRLKQSGMSYSQIAESKSGGYNRSTIGRYVAERERQEKDHG